MKRTNCPKFFVRTKVDNSGSCENISTRNKIYCHDFPENAYKCSTFCKSSLWRQKAFLVVMFMCFICLWFPARGGHSNASDTEQSGQSGSGHLICISLIQYSVPISAQICSGAWMYSDVLVMLYSIFIKNILACTCLHLINLSDSGGFYGKKELKRELKMRCQGESSRRELKWILCQQNSFYNLLIMNKGRNLSRLWQ